MTLSETSLAKTFREPPHQFLDIGHTDLAYWRFGSGPDLFFIHGWPLDAATFRGVLPPLAERFTCHLVDLPGIGQSVSRPGAPIDFVSHATSVRAAIDRLGLERYSILAHDSGGYVARLVAADDARVTRMVLGNTEIPGHTPALILGLATLARSGLGPRVLRTILKSAALRRSAVGFGGAFTDPSFVDGPFFDLFLRPLIDSDIAVRAQLEPLKSLGGRMMAKLHRAHQRITSPTQLIWGTKDPFFPIHKARKMAQSFGGPVSLEAIEGAKVFPHEDRADEFARHALRFLA
jgi:pimeloyl-ACP methyl ester carboxylesterase